VVFPVNAKGGCKHCAEFRNSRLENGVLRCARETGAEFQKNATVILIHIQQSNHYHLEFSKEYMHNALANHPNSNDDACRQRERTQFSDHECKCLTKN
jgi:hypothetical protein